MLISSIVNHALLHNAITGGGGIVLRPQVPRYSVDRQVADWFSIPTRCYSSG